MAKARPDKPHPPAGAAKRRPVKQMPKARGADRPTGRRDARYRAVPFDVLPGWAQDDHLAAFKTFVISCEKLMRAVRYGQVSGSVHQHAAMLAACDAARTLSAQSQRGQRSKRMTRARARAFFETYFEPHRVVHRKGRGLVTGYYEPLVRGARTPQGRYRTPVYKRPKDLVNLVTEAQRGAVGTKMTHARKTKRGLVKFPTRKEIELGALRGKRLELFYMADPVELYFLQIQGSGRVRLPDGSTMRVTYSGKNGYPYTSVGTYLIRSKRFPAHRMSLQALKTWLRADKERMKLLWRNQSYVFFRELKGAEAIGPHGVLNIPLTAGRSLAFDSGYHALGLPVYVSAAGLKHGSAQAPDRPAGFHRLMIGQDVGSAIKGPERGDLYFGSGPKAGRVAGITKHAATFYVLLPRLDLPSAPRARRAGTSAAAGDKPTAKKRGGRSTRAAAPPGAKPAGAAAAKRARIFAGGDER
ncbi:MAG: MltA domain-containing protein [Pseudomonadota bacterium]